ncbi:MAG: hypothetical protein VXV96_03150 [Bdellovibrionota bacterium]|jgi:hypothetical protein|nr:hypothetical protein [Bdellovibrionota bacterium]
MDLNEAIELVKNAVKESHIDGQKHVDLSLVDATERPDYEKALLICRAHVAQGHLSEEDLKTRLGLI